MSQTPYSNDDSPGFIYRKNLKFRSDPSDCYLGIDTASTVKQDIDPVRPRFDLYHLCVVLLIFWIINY